MASNRVVEYVFFFGLMGVAAYLVWGMLSPFISALAFAAIIATICYPLYGFILRHTYKNNSTIASFITVFIVLLVVILPLFLLSSAILREALAIYNILGSGRESFLSSLNDIEGMIQMYMPSFEMNIAEYMRQTAQWLASNLGVIFVGTASTIFSFFIALIAIFYFFRDGKKFTKWLVNISPLPNHEDELILNRMGIAVRSVATGIVLVAIIQGTLTALGLTIFGFERAILLGTIAAFGALIPSIGTSIVMVPAVLYLLFTGDYLNAIGLAVWGTLAVGLIDNLLGPYLMSRGNSIHPFAILLAVLGGISFFGPIGFVIGPVVVSFFLVLLELYNQHISSGSPDSG